MPVPAAVLALSLVVSAPQPSSRPTAAEPATLGGVPAAQMTWGEPPPGSADDRALFASAWKAQKEAITEHSWSQRMLSDLSALGYADRLYALAKDGANPRAKEAERLRERLGVAAKDVYAAAAQPPVDITHGCRPFLEQMASVMAPDAQGKDDLPRVRTAVTNCRDLLAAWTAPLAKANRAMEPLMADVEKLVGSPKKMTFAPGASPDVASPPRKD